MGKQRKTVLVLGEGPTEFYYFKSLCDLYKNLTIKPDTPKHTSMKELGKKIEQGVDLGYDYIFCVLDMDTKDIESEKKLYEKLKVKYATPIEKKKKGIHCQVKFFETHLCTELFFLYYFTYTSRSYANQDALLKDLNKEVFYEKTHEFFTKCKGLHSYFERAGGTLQNAIQHANRSLEERANSGRSYTYSQVGQLLEKLSTLG